MACSSALWIAGAMSAACGPGSPSALSQEASSPTIVAPPPSPPAAISRPPAPALPQSTPLSAQPSPFHITGTVVDSVTKSAVPHATLTAEPMNTAKPHRGSRRRFESAANTAESDSEGHFDLAVSSAGGWSLTAEGRGYRSQTLDEHDGYSTAIVLTEAAPKIDIAFRLTPASIIEGFVLDEAGEAVRGASVALLFLPSPALDDSARAPRTRAQQMSDDRGFYKFAGLGPGTYEVRVTAHPWYATALAGNRIPIDESNPPNTSSATSGPDPLDLVYATVWYPGAVDPLAATPIVLRGGETQNANFHLLPTPSSHLRIANPGGANGENELRQQLPNVYLSRLLPDGTEDPQQTPTRMDAHGNADIGGLAPGTYLVHQQTSSSGVSTLSTIQIGAGSPRTVDLSEGISAPTVTVKVDLAADLDSLQISFRDLETGHTVYAQRMQEFTGRQIHRRGASQDLSPPDSHSQKADRTVSLPPGRYEVFLSGIGDVHLASIDAVGAAATGRNVTIASGGAPKLFLHTAKGLGTVSGVVKLQGQPAAGAMVMLIPATLGNSSGLDVPSRDQSNTDGSFEMSGLLPGGYILIAVDHGWDVNWSDATTLRRYLLRGIPLDVKPGSDLKQTIQAQSP